MSKQKPSLLGFRAAPAEAARIRKFAADRGLPVSEVVRMAVQSWTTDGLLILHPSEARLEELRALGHRAAADAPELAAAVQRLRSLGQTEPEAQLALASIVEMWSAGARYTADDVLRIAGSVMARLLEGADRGDLAERARQEIESELTAAKPPESLH